MFLLPKTIENPANHTTTGIVKALLNQILEKKENGITLKKIREELVHLKILGADTTDESFRSTISKIQRKESAKDQSTQSKKIEVNQPVQRENLEKVEAPKKVFQPNDDFAALGITEERMNYVESQYTRPPPKRDDGMPDYSRRWVQWFSNQPKELRKEIIAIQEFKDNKK
jgi:DNA-binding transcriptional MerR regulator